MYHTRTIYRILLIAKDGYAASYKFVLILKLFSILNVLMHVILLALLMYVCRLVFSKIDFICASTL